MPELKTNLRRPPKQDRSRDRVDEILGAAKRLIGEKGVDAVKMREIAAQAGGPISSVYQYFPNKSAIIATIYSEWSASIYQLMLEKMQDVRSLEELFESIITVFHAYYDRIRLDPAIIDVLNAIQADKALKNIDVTETRMQAGTFCEVARPWIAEERFEAFQRITFLMFQLANGAVRLALAVDPDEARAIIDDYKTLIHDQLMGFAR